LEKKILIYTTDPIQSSDSELTPESVLNLQETTLQYNSEEGVHVFRLINKGAIIVLELDTPKGLFDLMFAVHRCWENVMDSSPFHLGKWLDRIGFYAALKSVDLKKVQDYCDDDEKYAMMRDDRNWTPLHMACSEGHVEMASLLLKYPVDVQFKNTSGETPLHCLFERKNPDQKQIIEFLGIIGQKVPDLELNLQTNSGTTYLHLTVLNGSTELSEWLVQKKVDPDKIDDSGMSPLLLAVKNGQVQVVKLMLDAGADIFQKTKAGQSALELAKEGGEGNEMYSMLFDIWETRRIQNQTNVINEILSTESDYVDRLQVLTEVFLRPMEKELHLSPKALKALFSNAEDIYKAASNFSKDLEQVRNLPPEKKEIGGLFVKNLAYFQMYIPYCTNQSISMKSLDVCLSHPHIAQFLKEKEIKNKEKMRSEKLDGFLIKPLQRITRFPLLLRELQKYTPDNHVDFAPLKEACGHMAEIVGKANEAKRERDHKDEVMENFGKQGVQWSLSSRLVGEGKCAIAGVDSKLDSTFWFLFNDVLILSKPSKGEVKYKIENLVILSTLPLLWEVKGKEVSKLCQYAFSIVLPDRANVKITICFGSKDERQGMMDILSTYIAEYMSENERKALLLSMKKGLAMKDTGKVVVEEKDKDRPIFFEELFTEGKEPLSEDLKARKERDKISFESKLLRRVGIEKDENVLEKLKRGQRGHDLDRKGMFAAVRNRDVSAIKSFLEQSADYCHIKDKRDASPLHIACQLGHLEAIQLLIDSGSDFGQRDKKGSTPFHWLFRCKYESTRETEKLLDGLSEAIDEGFVDFDAQDDSGNTCLHCAVQGEGEGQLVSWLIKKGKTDPNAQNKAGETPLYYAVLIKNVLAVSSLLIGGGDVWVKTTSSETIVDAAHDCGETRVWDLILRRLNDSRWTRPPPPKKAACRPTATRTLSSISQKHLLRSKDGKASTRSPSRSPITPSQWTNSAPSSSNKRESRTTRPVSGLVLSQASQTGNTNSSPSMPAFNASIAVPSSASPALPQKIIQVGDLILTLPEIKERKDELDQTRLEGYLTDTEFLEHFKISREEFYKKPAWKRTILKKDIDLF